MDDKKAPKAPPNTEKQIQDNPMLGLIVGMGPRGIENMEEQGQRDSCASDTLPSQGSDHPAFAEMGIVFGDPVVDDPLFRYCTLPAGWKKVPTDHAMWNDVVDETGKVRAQYFYKAAFYDRKANIHPMKEQSNE